MTTIKLQDRDDQGNFVLNTNQSNHLVYKESILSGYGITNFTKGSLIFRLAYVLNINYNATSLTSNNTNKDNYLSLFPSFSVNGNLKQSI
jgi:hypothetical protein